MSKWICLHSKLGVTEAHFLLSSDTDQQPGCDFLRETVLLCFSKMTLGVFEHHKQSVSLFRFWERQTSRQPTSPNCAAHVKTTDE